MAANTPEECDALFETYVNSGDLASLGSLYEDGGVLVQQEGIARGPEAIREALQPMLLAGARLRMNVVKSVTLGEIAVLYNDWTMTGKAPDGSDVEMAGKAIEVVRRQKDGTWLFVLDDPFGRG